MWFRSLPWLAAALCSVAFASPASPEPSVPAPDFVMLERAAPARDPAGEHLRTLRAELARRPSDAASASAYARAAIDLGRDRGDPRYFGFAQSALEPWKEGTDAPAGIRLLRATLAQREHRFADARTDLLILTATNPADAQPHLMLAVMDMVQGRPRQALEHCRALGAHAARLVTATCAAQAASLLGDAQRAQSSLLLALALDGGADPEVHRWGLTLAAEIAARRGDDRAARRLFESALTEERADPARRDVYLRSAWADFLLRSGETAPVLDLLASDTAIDTLLLRLAIAERGAGTAAFADHRDELAARFVLARARGDALHLQDEARFRLDVVGDAAGALALAVENWKAEQREPADALLLLRAAEAAHQRDAAAPVLDWMQETGIADPALLATADAVRALP